ncbi:MAG: DUF1963 domain-containing protein [Demequinaceae bacterium]|nr:DUF1963 domain-containing protein [Demequinaceae bacterium]
MNLDSLAIRLKAAGLPKVDEILGHAKPATLLKPTTETDPASASSRLGGRPILAPGVEWPRKDGTPLSLVAQIRLDPLHGATTVLGLPATGLLSFFYDIEGQAWGFDPTDRGSFAVVYTEDPEASIAADFPADLADEWRLPAVALNTEPTVTLPSPMAMDFPSRNLTDQEDEEWGEALIDLANELGWAERSLLGGHPDLIQGDMALECEIVAHAGVPAGDAQAYRDPRLEEWKAGAGEWVHLLQVASEEDAGLMWGDSGCLYFWMCRDDIEAGRFDRAWMILQCY